MAFQGFGPQALPFLKALAFHQTKEWFEDNRAAYESQLRGPLGDLVEDLASRFAKARTPLKGDRKASLFRINRDVRFAKDKSPYKTNAGAVLTRGGAKNDVGLFYIHIAADGCFAAAGFYQPEPDDLSRLRLAEAGLALSQDYAMKRAPRGFEDVADPLLAAALRNRSFICSRPIADSRLSAPALVDDLQAFAADAMPLLEWGWSAVVDAR
jgi:uncharacterized protein (DUF2461 family)